MSQVVTPKRIVLKCREQYFQDQREMVSAFFDSQGLKTLEDYYIHIYSEPSSPSSLFLVLDLYCKEIPDVDLSKLELQIFKVSKPNTLCVVSTNYDNITNLALSSTFRDLGEAARKQAHPRSLTLGWGTNQSSQRS